MFKFFSTKPGLVFISIAGTRTSAPRRHDPIDISVRYPKNRIEVKPESIRGEKPAITVLAFMIMLRPIVAMVVFVDSSCDNPFLI